MQERNERGGGWWGRAADLAERRQLIASSSRAAAQRRSNAAGLAERRPWACRGSRVATCGAGFTEQQLTGARQQPPADSARKPAGPISGSGALPPGSADNLPGPACMARPLEGRISLSRSSGRARFPSRTRAKSAKDRCALTSASLDDRSSPLRQAFGTQIRAAALHVVDAALHSVRNVRKVLDVIR